MYRRVKEINIPKEVFPPHHFIIINRSHSYSATVNSLNKSITTKTYMTLTITLKSHNTHFTFNCSILKMKIDGFGKKWLNGNKKKKDLYILYVYIL